MIVAVAVRNYEDLKKVMSSFSEIGVKMTFIGVTIKPEEWNIDASSLAKHALELSKDAVDIGIGFTLTSDKFHLYIADKKGHLFLGEGEDIKVAASDAYSKLTQSQKAG